MSKLDPKEAPVKTEDSLALAIAAAHARAAEVYADGCVTLIDSLSVEDFIAACAGDEKVLAGAYVADDLDEDERHYDVMAAA